MDSFVEIVFTIFGCIVILAGAVILVIGIGLPLLVGISRFILGVHYPTDVLVGWLMGIVLIVLRKVRFSKKKQS